MKNKRILFYLLMMIVVLGVGTPSKAALINRGTDSLGNRLIYDDDLDITWYDFTNSATTWQNQVDWAATLSVNIDGTVFKDWRLPSTIDGEWVWDADGNTTAGYNITTSELGHLFYNELQNQGFFDTSFTPVDAPNVGLINTGAFQNLVNLEDVDNAYWSGTEWAPDPVSARFNFSWYFQFDNGQQQIEAQSVNFFAIAVRDGDVVTFDDNDNDGFSSPEDCDDNDNTIYPDAQELCDSKDNDCNGIVDDITNTFWVDGDGDGYGDPAFPVDLIACSAPIGFSDNSDDCNDFCAECFPGNPEIPNNGIDEDCNSADLIAIDIAPKHCPNRLKKKDDDSCSDDDISDFKVVILGTQGFDVNTIDITTLNINGVTPIKIKTENVTAPSDLEPCDCEVLKKDKIKDLKLKFNSQAILATLGIVHDGDVIPLALKGNLLGGTVIEGLGCVVIEIKEKDDCSSDDDSRRK